MSRSSIARPNRIACSVVQTAFGSKRKRSPGSDSRHGAIALELVLRREHAAFELVRREAVLRLQLARMRDELVSGADRAPSVRGRVPEEQVRRERNPIAHAPAEDVADRHSPRLPEQVEAGKFERGDHLRAIVVERRGRVREQEPHLLEQRRVAADERSLQRQHRRNRRLAAAAHLAEPDEPVVGLDLDDRAHEAAPVAAVRMTQRRLERHRHRRRAHISDFQMRLALICTGFRRAPAPSASGRRTSTLAPWHPGTPGTLGGLLGTLGTLAP